MLNKVRTCKSCECKEEDIDGIVTFINDYCESCNDRMEKGRIEHEDSILSGDYNYEMNY